MDFRNIFATVINFLHKFRGNDVVFYDKVSKIVMNEICFVRKLHDVSYEIIRNSTAGMMHFPRKCLGAFSLKNYQLTRRGELEREVAQQALPRDVSDRAEYDDGAREAGMAEAHPLVGGELGHALAPHQVLPVVLRTQENSALF